MEVKNTFPTGRQLARTPQNHGMVNINKENLARLGSHPDKMITLKANNGKGENAHVLENKQNRTPLAPLSANSKRSKSRSAKKNSMRNRLSSSELSIEKVDMVSSKKTYKNDKSRVKNMIASGNQLSRTPQENTKVNVQKRTAHSDIHPSTDESTTKGRNMIASGNQLARSPHENAQENTKKTGSNEVKVNANTIKTKAKNLIASGNQLARTPLMDLKNNSQAINVKQDDFKGPKNVKQKNGIVTGNELARTPQEDSKVDARISKTNKELKTKASNLIASGNQLARTPQESIETSGTNKAKVNADVLKPKARNVIATGSQIARTPLMNTQNITQAVVAKKGVFEGPKAGNVITSGNQLVRTPQESIDILGTNKAKVNADVLKPKARNVIATGSQIARTPLMSSQHNTQEIVAKKDVFKVPNNVNQKKKNVIATGNQLARTPQDSTETSGTNKVKVNADTLKPKPRNVIASGNQLGRTPLSNTQNSTLAIRNKQDVFEKPKAGNVIASGSELARTHQENIGIVGTNKVKVNAGILKPKVRNVIASGNQIARTPQTDLQNKSQAIVVTQDVFKVSNNIKQKKKNFITNGNQLARTPHDNIKVDAWVSKTNKETHSNAGNHLVRTSQENAQEDTTISRVNTTCEVPDTYSSSDSLKQVKLDAISPFQEFEGCEDLSEVNFIDSDSPITMVPAKRSVPEEKVILETQDAAYLQHVQNVETCKDLLTKTTDLNNLCKSKRMRLDELEFQSESYDADLKEKANNERKGVRYINAHGNDFTPKTALEKVSIQTKIIEAENESLYKEMNSMKLQSRGNKKQMGDIENFNKEKSDLEREILKETQKLEEITKECDSAQSPQLRLMRMENEKLLKELRILSNQCTASEGAYGNNVPETSSGKANKTQPEKKAKRILRRVELFIARYESIRRSVKLINSSYYGV